MKKRDIKSAEKAKMDMLENFVKAAEAKEPNREEEFMDQTLQDAKKSPVIAKSYNYRVGSPDDLMVVNEVLRRVAGKAMDLQAVTGQLMDTVKDRGLTAEYPHSEMELVKVYNELKAILEKPELEKKEDVSRFAYFHRRGDNGLPRGMRYTIAYERTSITKEMIVAAVMNQDVPFEIRMGVAFCHSKDSFNKFIGREFAVSRIRPKLFKLVNFSNQPFGNDNQEESGRPRERSYFTLASADGTEIHGFIYNDTGESRFTHIYVPYVSSK